MKLYNQTITELIELEDEFHNERNDEIPGALKDLVDIQKILFDKLRENPDDEHAESIEVYRRKLVTNLIRYGAYLKTENEKNYQVEESALTLAIQYDPTNQSALYRLGVLAYEKKQYATAVGYFQKSLDQTHELEGYRFKLAPQQEYNALIYLKICALYTTSAAQASLNSMVGDQERSGLEQVDTSVIGDWITEGESYLNSHEYVFLTGDVKKYGSKTTYDEMINDELLHTLILDFTGKDIELRFNGRTTEIGLSTIEAELLEELMLRSSASRPLRSGQLQEPIFVNTYRQRVTRLRGTIGRLELSNPAIKNKTIRIGAGRATAHYYNQALPYMIIHRDSELY